MRVLHICNSDSRGGAAVAARRLHNALLSHKVDSHMYVAHRHDKPSDRIHCADHFHQKCFRKLAQVLESKLTRSLAEKTNVFWSLGIMPSINARAINKLKPDIVHLHWFNSGFISFRELQKIKAQLVWTLHDEWAFEDGRHYRTSDNTHIEARTLAQRVESLKLET